MGIPQLTGVHQRELLTGLSASFRARCYKQLVCHPYEDDTVVRHVHGVGRALGSQVMKDGGNNVLIRLLSDALARPPGRLAVGGSRPVVNPSHFLATAQQMRRISVTSPSRRRDATAIVRCQC